MLTVGLTGGIASGKSTVADLFKELGVPVIDADSLAREVVQPGSQGLSALVKHFGNAILQADGNLDRGKLRQIIFNDSGQRKLVEETLHPLIRARSEQLQLEHKLAGHAYCICDVPLLVETGQQHSYDRVLVVDVSEEVQATRVMARDNISRDDAMKIVASQASRTDRLNAATDVIRNESMLDVLASEVQALHQKFLNLAELNAAPPG